MSDTSSNPATDSTEAQEATNDQRRRSKRKRLLTGLAAVVILGAAAAGGYEFFYGQYHETTDDAYVDGNEVQLTPQVAGTVISITADDGDYVKQGQTLVQLDPADSEVALESAKAQLANAVRQVRGLYSDVTAYQAEVSTRKVELQQAQTDFNRRASLAKGGAVSKEELSHARDALRAAKNALTSAQQQLDRTQALVENTTLETHPQVLSAAANLRQAYLNHARTNIVAPVDGYIAQRSVQVGKQVQPGAALLAVIPLHQVWVDANFKETQIEKMRIGQPVELQADMYGSDLTYTGHIESLGVGTGSAFSLLPAQNASGNWIKIVQRLPVRIRLDDEQLAQNPLRIGLSMQVDVDLHNQQGKRLSETPVAKVRYATDVYDRAMQEANALIATLIQQNGGSDLNTQPATAHSATNAADPS